MLHFVNVKETCTVTEPRHGDQSVWKYIVEIRVNVFILWYSIYLYTNMYRKRFIYKKKEENGRKKEKKWGEGEGGLEEQVQKLHICIFESDQEMINK